jgi:putative PIN family toxin of toxin-antitoxin system
LVDALLGGQAILCASGSILAELDEVIRRDKFRRRLEQTSRSARDIISGFRAAALLVEGPTIRAPGALRDPDDLHLLTCAVHAYAAAIVSGDNDLLAMKEFNGIPIVKVRQALEKLGILPV